MRDGRAEREVGETARAGSPSPRGAAGGSGEDPRLPAPLAIVSVGRSGSTLLQSLLARHERLAWLSSACDRHPDDPRPQRMVMAASDLPLVGRLARRRWHPDECYPFWNHHFPGFGRPARDLREGDLLPSARATLRDYLAGLLSRRRPRLLLKVTGWPRAGFLRALLPEMRFVHLVRDGRAVAASLVQAPWWKGWGGPQSWRWGTLTPEEREAWRRHDESFVVLAGLQWRRVLRAMAEARERVDGERWMDVRYEDLCREPRKTLADILDFAGLPDSPAIRRALSEGVVRPPSDAWREELSGAHRRALDDVLAGTLREWGYA